ncbi:MAG: hypothetical protein K2X81_15325, partial [Candidatus Obscuribacterales bacterium]|nr:hypothetical protein [Candidatus Obscuribacterales bacterium]
MKIFDKNFGAIAKGALWLTSALWLTICAAANATPDNNIDSLREIPISPNISQNGRGMAVASYLSLQAAIHLVDTPISYSPPFGQPMDFEISYNSAKASHPSALALSNLGPGWSFNWLSFVTLDSAKNVTVTTRSGSSEFFQFRIKESETIKTPYSSSQMSHAKLIQAAEGKFHRLLPDGSVEIFNKPDGTGRILLTQVKDPQGNTTHIEYDTNFRIASVVDAIGQKTTIKYASESSNSLGFFKIIEIKDPFGRTAKFQYDQSFMHLLSSTDTIGLVSKYKYDPGSFFVAALTTPYGTSLFKKYTPKGSPPESEGIRTTLPNGDSQVIEHWAGDVRETYEWDRHALKLFPSDPEKQEHSHCNTTHWQIDAPSKREIAIPTFYKRPLESKIVYSYDGPSEHGFAGSIDLPIAITREIRITNPDGSTGKAKQVKKFEYNSFGKITKEIDPLGRTFSYKYADNEIDLLEKRQTRDGSNELVANWTYNKQHRPVKDGALHRNIEYNNFGEVTKITDAYQNSTSFDYDSKGYLLKVEGAIPGMRNLAKYSYDALGRRHTKTDADGITVILAYDNADRLTSTTFPDGSSEQIRYDKLDAVAIRDRSGKETKRTYSNLDQLTSVEDPLGRKIQYSWCSCGSLLTMTDPIGKTTTWHHDLQGRTIQKKFADGTEFNYTYEEGGHRLQSITDALKQTTNYNYNLDDTKAKITFTNAVNPTSPVSFKYERDYKVIHSVTNDWGTITYNHSNPVSGAGPLKSIANSAIPNSTITFEYDALGH